MLGGLILVALLAAVYPVAIYPALVALLARVRPRPWQSAPVATRIAHIIAVHNEADRIRSKLRNSTALVVPEGCTLETVVASDGSTDDTEAIVREFGGQGVRLVSCRRRGKEAALVEAIGQVDASILVFSDAAALIERTALPPILAPFADPQVLAVSGTDVVRHNAPPTGEDLYVRYEMGLRRAESIAGSLVGLSGCFFAVRRSLAEGFSPSVTSDLGSALLAIRHGGRAVAADAARCTYQTTRAMSAEFARKRRTVLRGLWCLWEFRDLILGAPRIVAWQILSHKWLRFAVPLWVAFALLLVGIEMAISKTWLHWGLLVIAACGLVGLLGLVLPRLRRILLAKALAFSTISVFAVLMAWVDFLRGRDETLWKPTVRT